LVFVCLLSSLHWRSQVQCERGQRPSGASGDGDVAESPSPGRYSAVRGAVPWSVPDSHDDSFTKLRFYNVSSPDNLTTGYIGIQLLECPVIDALNKGQTVFRLPRHECFHFCAVITGVSLPLVTAGDSERARLLTEHSSGENSSSVRFILAVP
jgi:hypothetical protein